MGYEAKKTEHAGSKKGRGAFWGYKRDAKKQSNRRRRENDKREAMSSEEALARVLKRHADTVKALEDR